MTRGPRSPPVRGPWARRTPQSARQTLVRLPPARRLPLICMVFCKWLDVLAYGTPRAWHRVHC